MTWNNRIIKKTKRNPIKGSNHQTLHFYDVHEVFYYKNGKPRMWTKDPIIGGFDSIKDLRNSLAQMLGDVLQHPVMEAKKVKGKLTLVSKSEASS